MKIESDDIIREIVSRDIKKMIEEKKAQDEQTGREYSEGRMPYEPRKL